jgi:hypothetical protein
MRVDLLVKTRHGETERDSQNIRQAGIVQDLDGRFGGVNPRQIRQNGSQIVIVAEMTGIRPKHSLKYVSKLINLTTLW